MSLQIKIDGIEGVIDELQKRGADVAAALELICKAGGLVILEAAKANANGSIADGMPMETTQKTRSRVAVDVGPSRAEWYARFLEFGTTAHRIRPKDRQAIVIDGNVVAGANHPGAREQPFLRPAFDAKQGAAQAAIGRKAKEAIGA